MNRTGSPESAARPRRWRTARRDRLDALGDTEGGLRGIRASKRQDATRIPENRFKPLAVAGRAV
jgi:hypothetical protein